MNAAAIDFLRSQLLSNIKIPTVVINDDGFLPQEVESPIQFYCNFSNEINPLYFDMIKLPRFYRIVANANKGEIYDLDKKRGEIVFLSNDNSRLVKEIRWLDDKGQVSWSDHYNQQGKLFCKSFYSAGKESIRKYFDEFREVITWYLQSGDIFLNYNNETLHFGNIAEFINHYLHIKNYDLHHIFYNSLNQALLTTLDISTKGSDTLFWQEKLGGSLPGNMEYLIKNTTRTKHIVFQNYIDWKNWKDKLPQSENVNYDFLGVIYPHPRGNKLRPEALILTNSDQIENLQKIVTSMPNVNFHIAAITEMSDKLLSLEKYNNVYLYPNALREKLLSLYKICDVYLDINHGSEVLDAVRAAFEQNMLIVGFDNTLHNANFVNPENIFLSNQVDSMIQKIDEALKDSETMRKLIDKQRLVAGDETPKKYVNVIEELTNDE